ncbi:hypothetical protein CAPTEDRAFT_219172 [Capitella teleta]|uniref:Mab-21-like HhH/H2TH-like domain-containing protein n=1 Tax=Capitella teleta TaxID=283909 RepID=R7V8Z5_CAPTE|nr:hypothetical protein CAPTEDRAFT_219172 [Capitella teleta]|eukprot:ELU14987.1 hypothetical protein CAPTEDRAFT_219172 [Capitella teleta]
MGSEWKNNFMPDFAQEMSSSFGITSVGSMCEGAAMAQYFAAVLFPEMDQLAKFEHLRSWDDAEAIRQTNSPCCFYLMNATRVVEHMCAGRRPCSYPYAQLPFTEASQYPFLPLLLETLGPGRPDQSLESPENQTSMMWMLEETEPSHWDSECPSRMAYRLLERLLAHLDANFWPYYFIPSYNIMSEYSLTVLEAASKKLMDSAVSAMTTDSKTAAKKYISKNEVPQLFESITAGLLHHRPEFPLEFVQDCLDSLGGDPGNVKWNTFIEWMPPPGSRTASRACSAIPRRDATL